MARLGHFRELAAWKQARRLTVMAYEVTKALPPEERHGLVPGMRRAAVSVAANIVEGSKRREIREKVRFYSVAEDSLRELEHFFTASQDLGYLETVDELQGQAETAGRLLNGLIRSMERRLG